MELHSMVNSEEFKPDKLTVRQVLTDSYNFYTIPEYQRPFKWREKHIERFIKDIKESMDTGGYFIGSIILVKKTDGYDIIDGQQRLTTLLLIFSAFYHKYGSGELKKCLVDEELNRSRIRISPRIDQRNEFQEGFLAKILNGEEPDEHGSNVFSKYYYLTKKLLLANEVYEEKESATTYYRYLLDRVDLIRIITDSEGSAVKLFYVMNTTGTSLSSDEVIKVILYDGLSDRDRETFMGSWREIEKIQKQLQILWDPFSELDRIFTLYSYYYLVEKPKTLVYDVYKKMRDKGEDPLKIIYKVKHFAESLLELNKEHLKDDKYVTDDRVLYPFYYLYDTVYWQVILATAIDVGYTSFSDLVQELFRLYYLNWIAGHNTANVGEISIRILKLVKDNKPIHQIVTITEEKIKDDNLEKQAFENLDKDVYVDTPKSWLRAVLSLIEYNLYDDSGTNYIEEVGKSAPSIDHILPRGWKNVDYWTKKWVESDVKEAIYKLGNLTYISLSKNEKERDLDFISKRDYFAGSTGNAKSTRYKLNDSIIRYQDWDHQAFSERQKWMLESLRQILKPPNL